MTVPAGSVQRLPRCRKEEPTPSGVGLEHPHQIQNPQSYGEQPQSPSRLSAVCCVRLFEKVAMHSDKPQRQSRHSSTDLMSAAGVSRPLLVWEVRPWRDTGHQQPWDKPSKLADLVTH